MLLLANEIQYGPIYTFERQLLDLLSARIYYVSKCLCCPDMSLFCNLWMRTVLVGLISYIPSTLGHNLGKHELHNGQTSADN